MLRDRKNSPRPFAAHSTKAETEAKAKAETETKAFQIFSFSVT